MLLLSVVTVFGVVSATMAADVAMCTDSQAQWTFNSLFQSPCEVASRLGSLCDLNGISMDVPALSQGKYYTAGPFTNACRCSTVVYSLLSACTICQSGTYINWSNYILNCTTGQTNIGFRFDIPPDTKVPHYAYQDVITSTAFNRTLAQENSSAPESTHTQPAGPTASSSPPKSSRGGAATAGPIVGGVFFALALTAGTLGLFYWVFRCFRRRRREQASKPGTGEVDVQPPPSMVGRTSIIITPPSPHAAPGQDVNAQVLIDVPGIQTMESESATHPPTVGVGNVAVTPQGPTPASPQVALVENVHTSLVAPTVHAKELGTAV